MMEKRKTGKAYDAKEILYAVLVAGCYQPGFSSLLPSALLWNMAYDLFFFGGMTLVVSLLILDIAAESKTRGTRVIFGYVKAMRFTVSVILLHLLFLVLTLKNGGDTFDFLRMSMRMLGISILVDYILARYGLRRGLAVLLLALEMLIYANFISMLIWPNGIVYYQFIGSEYIMRLVPDSYTPFAGARAGWYLGHQTALYVPFVTGIAVALLCDYHAEMKFRASLRTFALAVACVIQVAIAGSMANYLILLLFMTILVIHGLGMKRASFSLVFWGGIVLLLFFLVYIFRIQTHFASLLEVFQRSADLSGRLQIWERAITHILQRPLIGYGHLGSESSWRHLGHLHAHNNYLQILFTGGIIGFAGFAAFIIVNAIRISGRHSWDSKIAMAAAGSLFVGMLNDPLIVRLIIPYILFGVASHIGVAKKGASRMDNENRDERASRTFFITWFPSRGPRGGPGKGMLQLLQANKEYRLIPDAYGIFRNDVFAPDDDLPGDFSLNRKEGLAYKVKGIFRPFLPKGLLARRWLFLTRRKMRMASAQYRSLHERYSFTERDVFIIHDHFAAYSFIKEFPDLPILTVYHHQGSLYNNFVANNGVSNPRQRRYLDALQKFVLDKSRFIGFPSQGALTALQKTAPDILSKEKSGQALIFYNGVSCQPVDMAADSRFDFMRCDGKLKFATVTALQEAKGAERIPRFLGALKKRGMQFAWVVVGNGAKADALSDEIMKNEISENTLWIKDYIADEEIKRLFCLADFYIMFHRHSIFDLATLEAMGHGCIPVLTPVGGNLEVIIRDNGLLVRDMDDTTDFEALLAGGIDRLKKRNIELQQELFSDYACLRRYADFAARHEELQGDF